MFNDQVVNVGNRAYRVTGYQENKGVFLQDLVTLQYISMPIVEFMDSVIDTLIPGSEFNSMDVDVVVKVPEFAYIKGAYNEILNNFTSFMGEAVSLSDDDLMQDLKKEITKCK
jgi:hypothetical protein